jgi:molecular chaperone DnaK
VRPEIEQAVNRLKDVTKSDDAAVIERAIKDLTTASYKVGEAVYKSAAAASGAPGGPQPGPTPDAAPGPAEPKKDDDVIDAEYEVKK